MRMPSILVVDSKADSPVAAIGDHVWQEEPCPRRPTRRRANGREAPNQVARPRALDEGKPAHRDLGNTYAQLSHRRWQHGSRPDARKDRPPRGRGL